jgi:hypothetical protein
MGTARDIALIFLSLQAFIVSLIPLAIFGGLAYGVYRLRGWTKTGLQTAQAYAQTAHEHVEKASRTVVEPLVRIYATVEMITTIVNRFFSMFSKSKSTSSTQSISDF